MTEDNKPIPDYLQLGEPECHTESILEEAFRLTHGPRSVDYGHPLDDYQRVADIMTALVGHKLKPGQRIEPADASMFMIGVKLSRQVNKPKRDNTVDGAGYFWVTQAIQEELTRRSNLTTKET